MTTTTTTTTTTKRTTKALLLSALCASGCANTYDEVEGDITYAEVPSPLEPGGVHKLTLDIKRPDGDGPFPAIVFIHGGGWTIGNLRADNIPERIDAAVDEGFVGITVGYRRADHNDDDGTALHPWPAQIADVNCALRWVVDHAEEHHVDVDRVGVMGSSAGGHLAMMAAYAQRESAFAPGPHCEWTGTLQPRAVVGGVAGANVAMIHETTEWWVRAYIDRWLELPQGTSTVDAFDTITAASPLPYMSDAPSTPTLVLAATDDTLVVPLAQQSWHDAAKLTGQDVTLRWLEGAGHDHDVTHKADVTADALSFFAEHL